ncbi:hypothetical protein SAMN02745111_02068 [Eubacterium uniforme]|uniref:Uncharacterized protein n=1 Tax=Eubacterium uniforme TaxID=39495 RepID=A0A1T4W1R3_9FIRM|nr:hypothetical protein SAMN02745111_02068 [Eubacterium uniforme]
MSILYKWRRVSGCQTSDVDRNSAKLMFALFLGVKRAWGEIYRVDIIIKGKDKHEDYKRENCISSY